MISVKNLTKKYESAAGDVMALDHLTLDIVEGEFVAITGRSGSGKSTFLYQMGLLDHPSSGTITIGNTEITSMSSKERTRFRLKELGYVFQDYAILPTLTALENVIVPLLMLGYDSATAEKKAKEALAKVGITDRMHNLPSQLSGGQQQRVSIARAISHDPKILFADEPTANLDSETSDMVLDAFLELNKAGQTIIMVTHEKEYAALADRTVTLSDGKIISDVHK
jgi:putative ABC transport system ATP-binding protein